MRAIQDEISDIVLDFELYALYRNVLKLKLKFNPEFLEKSVKEVEIEVEFKYSETFSSLEDEKTFRLESRR